MLLPGLTNKQLIDKAKRLEEELYYLVDRAFQILPFSKRVEESRAGMPNPIKILVTRTALEQRGFKKEAEELNQYYRGALRAAGLNGGESDSYSLN